MFYQHGKSRLNQNNAVSDGCSTMVLEVDSGLDWSLKLLDFHGALVDHRLFYIFLKEKNLIIIEELKYR